ncbi:putative Phospholipid-transporting ATPase IA [Giardia muris]|uniref:Putative Phospholipid-transporting ATPase IA n=1 Tax=Giardia muris TaxID=5742 RepID=A0A4Z1SSP3_GIAMU|nr:putative Phospholipid-transporting ATPase IA [Giardia muris]|eukprot:TNJ28884.1 putative Phospholipid-transporting ATPase IA [Giardia muris]
MSSTVDKFDVTVPLNIFGTMGYVSLPSEGTGARTVRVNHYPSTQKNSNKFRSSQYTALTFVPLFLWHYISKFSNIAFLIIMILNYLPGANVVSSATALIPVLFIFVVSLVKDLIEVALRWRNDQAINRTTYPYLLSQGQISSDVRSDSLNPGDIVRVPEGKAAPCDILLICSASNNPIYVSQSSLTGEANLVAKRCLYPAAHSVDASFLGCAEYKYEAKHAQGTFSGPLASNDPCLLQTYPGVVGLPLSAASLPPREVQTGGDPGTATWLDSKKRTIQGKHVAPLPHTQLFDERHLCFQGTRATTDYFGIVLATGKQCFSAPTKSTRRRRSSLSSGRLQAIIMIQCVLVIVFVLAYSSIYTGSLNKYEEQYPYLRLDEEHGNHGAAFFTTFVGYVVLFSYALPICIFVSLEFIMILNRAFLAGDIRTAGLYGPLRVNNDKILDEFSNVAHIFTDKTGTLTRNQFSFKRFLSAKVCSQLANDALLGQAQLQTARLLAADENDDDASTRLLQLVAMGTCHSLICIASGEDGMHDYFGESVEELCYIRYLTEAKILRLVESTDQRVVLEVSYEYLRAGRITLANEVDENPNPRFVRLSFVKLAEYPFTPERKRMTVIVYQEHDEQCPSDCIVNNGRPFLVTKGSYVTVKEGLEMEEQELVETVINGPLADKRCFVFAFRTFVSRSVLTQSQKDLENGSTLLGLSVIEDELAPHVFETITKLRLAGIKFTIVTGDSVGTTIETAKRVGIISRGVRTYELNDLEDIRRVHDTIGLHPDETFSLVIAGSIVSELLPDMAKTRQIQQYLKGKEIQENQESNLSLPLFELLDKAESSLFCGCTPNVKRLIVLYHSVYYRKVMHRTGATLAIGDGQNDLKMLDVADVSVGIRGKEGIYAANRADISIGSFSSLTRLLLVHGVSIQQRMSMCVFYNLYKNTMLAIVCGLHGPESLFTAVLVINDFLCLIYNVILNFVPIIIYSLTEQHIKMRYLELCPTIYREQNRPGQYWGKFALFYLSGIYTSLAIYYFIRLLWGNSLILGSNGRSGDFTVYCFYVVTCIIYAGLVKLCIVTRYFSSALIWSILASMGLYYLTTCVLNYSSFFSETFENTLTTSFGALNYHLACVLTTLLAVLPDYICESLGQLFIHPDPNSLLRYHFKTQYPQWHKKHDVELELKYQNCATEVSERVAALSAKGQPVDNALFQPELGTALIIKEVLPSQEK